MFVLVNDLFLNVPVNSVSIISRRFPRIVELLPKLRLIESIMGLRTRQGNLRRAFRLFSLMRGLPSIRIK